MANIIDMIEDGEIENDSDQDEEVYRKVDRPQSEANLAKRTQDTFNTDSSESCDSDDGSRNKKLLMKRFQHVQPASTNSASHSKNGNLWKNMLQEETLMENLKTCDVSSSRKRKYERGAESYDFENAQKDHEIDEISFIKSHKRRKMDISGNESSSSNASSRSAKRARKNRYKQRRKQRNTSPRILSDLSLGFNSTDEEFGIEMAQKLEEEKSELIVKVVSVIGKEASLNLFKITQKIEVEGGMMTMMKNRRRTPGGIFLFLLKTSDKIDEELKKKIFDSERKSIEKTIVERKMSSEQSEAKDPPNSPANSEFIEINGKITDPDLVSQKILNFKPEAAADHGTASEDVLDLDYSYDDMETF
ncbi:CLUMA_CG019540, isoform A [Clunio marinus]|uniref:Phosphorylated adapter RNA export protein n=1 Tax=Clunio marinus TaxID=568069 RepID=A0A1J1J4H8_9DIPT|nr:CLUMA_CG019540, isoform A [Clunio marinus]